MHTKTIDAHHHFLPVFEPDLLRPELDRSGVTGTVLIESVDTADENDRLLAYAADVPYVKGVVGWLPLADPAVAYVELDRLPTPPVVGVRCLIGRDPSDWLVGQPTIDLFRELAGRGLAWDVVPVNARQVDHVCRIAGDVPELRIVVDHLCRPPVEGGELQPWSDWLDRLAAHTNVACKVSIGIDALRGWTSWDTSALPRYVRQAVSAFGAERLMLASNWPVVLHRTPYADAWTDLGDALRQVGLDDAGLSRVSGGTAIDWYRLDA